MKTQKIKIFDILKLPVAISVKQGEKIVEKFNGAEVIILDFNGILDVTTAFFNCIFDYFVGKINKIKDIFEVLKIENHNDSVKFAYVDAYELFKERLEK